MIGFLLFVLWLLLFKYLDMSDAIYNRFGGNVPAATKFVLGLGSLVQSYIFFSTIIYLLFISGVVMVLYKYKNSVYLVQLFISLLIAIILVLAYLPIFQMGASIVY
jgi:type II secretory pathway component PulF